MKQVRKANLKDCIAFYTKFCSGFLDLTPQEKQMLEHLITRDFTLSKSILDNSLRESIFLDFKYRQELQTHFGTRQNVQRLLSRLKKKGVIQDTQEGSKLDSDLHFKPLIHIEFEIEDEDQTTNK